MFILHLISSRMSFVFVSIIPGYILLITSFDRNIIPLFFEIQVFLSLSFICFYNFKDIANSKSEITELGGSVVAHETRIRFKSRGRPTWLRFLVVSSI